MDAVPPEWLDTPASLQEIDAKYGTPASGLHKEWEELKQQMRLGDQLVHFVSPADSWRHLAGRAGIALVRDGKVIAAMVTLMN